MESCDKSRDVEEFITFMGHEDDDSDTFVRCFKKLIEIMTEFYDASLLHCKTNIKQILRKGDLKIWYVL